MNLGKAKTLKAKFPTLKSEESVGKKKKKFPKQIELSKYLCDQFPTGDKRGNHIPKASTGYE